MIALTRSVRLNISIDDQSPSAGPNSHAGTPPILGLPAFYQLDITCTGTPDPDSGYLLNISHIDNAVRKSAPHHLRQALAQGTQANVPQILIDIASELRSALPAPLTSLTLRISNTAHCTLEALDMTEQPTHVLLTQSFSFAAAHRLHIDARTDEENLATFGKCNNPNGHGHNYTLDVTIKTPIANDPSCSFEQLETFVARTILDRYDHKHLNLDTQDFAHTNPSVEHITQQCFSLLADALAAQHPGTSLHTVRVWETEKTCATLTA